MTWGLRALLFIHLLTLALLWGVHGSAAAAEPPRESQAIDIAVDGQAQMPIVVSADASTTSLRAAASLADVLGRVTGGSFDIVKGDGTTGLAVGTPDEFPALRDRGLGADFDAGDIARIERFLLRSHSEGVYLLGVTPRGAQNAVWTLMHRLGHRQFFAGQKWEILPSRPTLAVAVDIDDQPDFINRRIWGGGRVAETEADFFAWIRRNRVNNDERRWDDGVPMDGGGFAVQTGHVYQHIVRHRRQQFIEHPEYLPLIDGQRISANANNPKLCISNPDMRALVVDWALQRLERNPEQYSISMDPSDGGGWCECEPCAAMGSVTDRVVLLANQVAEAVTQRYPDKYVGIYAYNLHSPPPTVQVHPHVIVSIATSYVRLGYTPDDLLSLWRTEGKVNRFGIRDYLSVLKWDMAMPGDAAASDLLGLAQNFQKYHDAGARFYNSEMGGYWGAYGLGYYVAARMLWDIENAERVDEMVDEFLTLCFADAKAPMSRFFRMIYRTETSWRRPMLSHDLVGRMYRLLDEASRQTRDPAVQARLDDLILYTRYVELYFQYRSAEGEQATLDALEQLMRHVYRIRHTYMIDSQRAYDVLMRPTYRRVDAVPANVQHDAPAAENPWKQDAAPTSAEIRQMLAEGIEHNPTLDFTAAGYSGNLIPARRLTLNEAPTGTFGKYGRRERTYLTWIDQAGDAMTLSARAGLIYGNRGPAKFTLYPHREALGQSVAYAEAPPDTAEHPLTLRSSHQGLHRLVVQDGSDGTAVGWPDGQIMTREASGTQPAVFSGRWQLCFYVPRGTQVVGGYAENQVTFHDGDGKAVHQHAQAGYFTIAVPPGQDGRIWWARAKFGSLQKFSLLTVPPYLARNGDELLLPVEVITRDAE